MNTQRPGVPDAPPIPGLLARVRDQGAKFALTEVLAFGRQGGDIDVFALDLLDHGASDLAALPHVERLLDAIVQDRRSMSPAFQRRLFEHARALRFGRRMALDIFGHMDNAQPEILHEFYLNLTDPSLPAGPRTLAQLAKNRQLGAHDRHMLARVGHIEVLTALYWANAFTDPLTANLAVHNVAGSQPEALVAFLEQHPEALRGIEAESLSQILSNSNQELRARGLLLLGTIENAESRAEAQQGRERSTPTSPAGLRR